MVLYFSQTKFVFVTEEICTYHRTDLNLSQNKFVLVTEQICACHRTNICICHRTNMSGTAEKSVRVEVCLWDKLG